MLFRGFIWAGLGVLASFAGCGGDGGFPDAGIDATSRGTVSLSWSIVDPAGRAVACDAVGASSVYVELRSRTSIAGTTESFGCKTTPNQSREIEAGVYDVLIELHGAPLTGVAAPTQSSVTVVAGEVTQLDPITFVVDPTGTLVLRFLAPPNTVNCAGGAGITGVILNLTNAAGACAPLTFMRSRGGVYTVNCASPPVTTCIEADETLTAADIQAGEYRVDVRGKVGASECWLNRDGFRVPPQGKTLDYLINLARQEQIPGC